MPWSTIDDVPAHLKHYGLGGANKWGEVFDALKHDGHDEDSAAAIATTTVQKMRKGESLGEGTRAALEHAGVGQIDAGAPRLLVQVRIPLEKGGEGSRGGVIIGHTRSGKPIYANGKRRAGYSKEDHVDATFAHMDASHAAMERSQMHRAAGDTNAAGAAVEEADTHYAHASAHHIAAHGSRAIGQMPGVPNAEHGRIARAFPDDMRSAGRQQRRAFERARPTSEDWYNGLPSEVSHKGETYYKHDLGEHFATGEPAARYHGPKEARLWLHKDRSVEED